jgi:uncharacterized protein involved in exopolysaccharide biosynthesis
MVEAFVGRVSVDPCAGAIWSTSRSSRSAKFAADAVNMLIDSKISENLEIKLQSTQSMLDWLDKELATSRSASRKAKEARDARKENALSLDDKQNIVSRASTS